MIMCKKTMFLFSFFGLERRFSLWNPQFSFIFLSAFIHQALSSPWVPALRKVLFSSPPSSYRSASCLPFPPADGLHYILWALDFHLPHLLCFALAWWCVSFSLSGPKALDLMWQLFAVPNDGLGRKGWAHFPSSQRREAVTSTSVSWLFPSVLIFF